MLGLKLEFLLAVGIGSSYNFPSFEKTYFQIKAEREREGERERWR